MTEGCKAELKSIGKHPLLYAASPSIKRGCVSITMCFAAGLWRGLKNSPLSPGGKWITLTAKDEKRSSESSLAGSTGWRGR